MNTRSMLYLLAKLIGDFNAFRRGRIIERVSRRITGRLSSRLLSRLHR